MVENLSLSKEEEDIVALASGQGASAIAILRLSGRRAHELLKPCLRFQSKQGPKINYQHLSNFLDPKNGTVIDEVMCSLFKAPRSYTGQDSAEIYCHGSPYIVQKILSILVDLGFRHAEPGEFTRRAFLSGKIDLSEAEGIHALITAESEQQWSAARELYKGALKTYVEELSDKIINAIAWLEASIDFPEEDDTSQIQRQQIYDRVLDVDKSLKKLLSTYSSGKVASQGLRIAFVGEPNVGKSTLMNTLLNSERAIVTDLPGTTRDFIEEPCLINGRLVRLIDTAGIRKSAEKIESIGIEKTFELAKEADLVLFLTDSLDNAKVIESWVQKIKPDHALKVHTKSDLLKNKVDKNWISISCREEHGLDTLKEEIQSFVDSNVQKIKDTAFINTIRHKTAVEEALKSIEKFFEAFQAGAYDEILAFELHQAIKNLHSIIGEVNTEDILDRVFSSFCVGK